MIPVIRPENDDGIPGQWSIIQGVYQTADHGVGKKHGGNVTADEASPLLIVEHPLLPMPPRHLLTCGRNVIRIALENLGHRDLSGGGKLVEPLLRCVPRHVRAIDSDREKQRLVMFLGELLLCPTHDLAICHLVVGDVEGRPIHVAAVVFRIAVLGHRDRVNLDWHLLGLGGKVGIPRFRIEKAFVGLLIQGMRVIDFAPAHRLVTMILEVLRQGDDILEIRTLSPILLIVVDAANEGADTGQQGGPRRIARRDRTVGVGEQNPSFGQSIDVRCLRFGVLAQCKVVQIIDRDKQDIRRLRGCA